MLLFAGSTRRQGPGTVAYAAEHMWHFHNLNAINQHQLVTQWIRLKDKTDKK
jgi:hypothetical protein